MTPLIRCANPDEATWVTACAARAYARYVQVIGRPPAPMTADFAALIRSGEVYLALDAARTPLGFIVFRATGADMLLENVAVDPAAEGRGVGKALIAYCEAEARRRGLTAVRLYTNEKMQENLEIYPHLGYRETARRIEDGFRRVYFEKQL